MVFRDLGFDTDGKKHSTLIMEKQLNTFQTEATFRVIPPNCLLFKLQLFSFESPNDASKDNKELPLQEGKKKQNLAFFKKNKFLDCVDSCRISYFLKTICELI